MSLGVDSLKGRQAGHRLGSWLGWTRRWTRPGSQEAGEPLSSGGVWAPGGPQGAHRPQGVCGTRAAVCERADSFPGLHRLMPNFTLTKLPGNKAFIQKPVGRSQ